MWRLARCRVHLSFPAPRAARVGRGPSPHRMSAACAAAPASDGSAPPPPLPRAPSLRTRASPRPALLSGASSPAHLSPGVPGVFWVPWLSSLAPSLHAAVFFPPALSPTVFSLAADAVRCSCTRLGAESLGGFLCLWATAPSSNSPLAHPHFRALVRSISLPLSFALIPSAPPAVPPLKTASRFLSRRAATRRPSAPLCCGDIQLWP